MFSPSDGGHIDGEGERGPREMYISQHHHFVSQEAVV